MHCFASRSLSNVDPGLKNVNQSPNRFVCLPRRFNAMYNHTFYSIPSSCDRCILSPVNAISTNGSCFSCSDHQRQTSSISLKRFILLYNTGRTDYSSVHPGKVTLQYVLGTNEYVYSCSSHGILSLPVWPTYLHFTRRSCLLHL